MQATGPAIIAQRYTPRSVLGPTRSRVGAAVALFMTVAAWHLVAQARDPRAAGIDFWHFRAVNELKAAGLKDPYAREGRAWLFSKSVEPVLAPLADSGGVVDGDALAARGVLTRESRAALQAAQLDTPLLGYQGVDTVASPFLFAVFSATSGRDYDADHFRFVMFSALCFLSGSFLIARMFGLSTFSSGTLSSLAAFGFVPLRVDLAVGNVNSILLALITFALWLAGTGAAFTTVAGGTVLGLAVCFKPSVVLIVPAVYLAWMSAGQHRPAFWWLLGAALGCSIGWAAAVLAWDSVAIWSSWMRILPEIGNRGRSLSVGNFSATTLLWRGSGAAPSLALGVLLVLPAAVAVITASRRLGPAFLSDAPAKTLRSHACAAAAVALAVTILSSRLAWSHYYVLLLPTMWMVIVRTGEMIGARRWFVGAGVTLAALSFSPAPRFVRPDLDGFGTALVYVSAASILLALAIATLVHRARPIRTQ